MKNYSVGIYEKAFPETLDVPEMLMQAKASGYDFFEINIDRTEMRISRVYDEHYLYRLEKAVEKHDFSIRSLGLSALGVYTLGNHDDRLAQRGMDIFRHTIIFAEKLGVRIVQIPACDMPKYDVRTADTRKKFIYNLSHAVEFAEKYGVTLGIENMENDFMDSITKCKELVQAINSPYLQLYPDSGNITNAWKNDKDAILADMELCAGRSVAFHLKEVQAERYGGLFYGEGHVNFKMLARKAYDLGIRRFGMEYWHTENENWIQRLREARELCDFWIGEN